jgi:putative transposase
MAWNASNVMEERMRFVLEHQSGLWTMTELCGEFDISRETGYEWLRRYRESGPAGLANRPLGPHRHGRATPAAVVDSIVGLRRERPTWGPRKIVAKLSAQSPGVPWPSPSTAGEILKRAGLVAGRRVKRRAPPRVGELTQALKPNHVWRADHKGWVMLGDRKRLEPLTVTDGFSRFLVLLEATASTRTEEAKPLFEKAFKEFGLPDIIRTDNGTPFVSSSVTGLTDLGVWWIKLGILHERIDPGSPQQNGSHERFHGTLKSEAMAKPDPDRATQQRRFDAYRKDFNEERPHEALGQKPPAEFYKIAHPRPLPDRLREPEYPTGTTVRQVRSRGQIKWRAQEIHIGEALIGETLALEEDEAGTVTVRFFDKVIGVIEHEARHLKRPARTSSTPPAQSPKSAENVSTT